MQYVDSTLSDYIDWGCSAVAGVKHAFRYFAQA